MTRTQIYDEAYSRIPGYDAATRDTATASAWMTELSAPPSALQVDTAAELRAAADAGKPFPRDLPARVREAQAAATDHFTALTMVREFAADAKARQQAALASGADHGLAYLRGELESLVTEVRGAARSLRSLPTDPLDVATDPTADRRLREAADLVERYSAIRDVQRTLIRTASSSTRATDNGTRMYLTAGQVADFLDADQYWIQRRRDNGRWPSDLRTLSPEQEALREWLTRSVTPMIDGEEWRASLPSGTLAEKAEALARICTHAHPWMPSMDDLANAFWTAGDATEGNASSPLAAEGGIRAVHRVAAITGHTSEGAPPEPVSAVRGGTRHAVPFTQRRSS
ncbi:hypothetical protein [Sinomonas sp. P10A9]|uniref:DUF222 domain-containing protein n=1 Tax=Sinomonas puerhi TaxID=3238584 RepID=A0AB39L1M0_9MICC